jgi:tetratricopeptide (TPR) repeat protein
MPAKAAAADPERLLDEGRVLHAAGRLNDAFARYQAALAAAPEHPDALHLLGVAYLGLGQVHWGVAFLQRAIRQRPDAAAYHANLATALAQQDALAASADAWAAALRLQPESAAWHAALADVRLRLQQPAQAEQAYQAAVALAPDQPAWHDALAHLQCTRWAMPEAVASARRAANLRGFDPAQPLGIGHAEPTASAAPPAVADRELHVIDDVLPDPLAFRDEALQRCAQQAVAQSTANFPGLQTPALPCQPMMQRIADTLGRPVKWNSPDNGALRLSLAGDWARADVHVDNPRLPNILGGVLCLALPQHCRGGTAFFRHRDSGWERRPDQATLRAQGFDSFLAFQQRHLPANRRQRFAEWQQQRDSVWQQVLEVEMRFNRLILFRSDFFHAITDLFGDRPENGRLVQLFHFETPF